MGYGGFLGFMLTLLLASMLFVVFDVPVVGSFGSIYVRAEGSADPPTAPMQTGLSAFSEPPATEWSKTYGGTSVDWAHSVKQTSDGGYILAGSTESFGAGGSDFWLVKTDAGGNMQWSKTYGGTGIDEAHSVVRTSDGGYAIGGSTFSSVKNGYYVWLVKTDASGNMQWNKTYGYSDDEIAMSVVQTTDGGYALAGYTDSFGAGNKDFWLIKTDATGNMQWNKTIGGTNDEVASSVVQTTDGGYALAGYTDSFGAGSKDFWLVKIAPPTYTLTITATSGGTTNPPPGIYFYSAGRIVSVTAMPDTHYSFDHWELDSSNVGSTNPYSVLMNTDHMLHAVFVYLGIHDVALTNLTISKTVVGQGFSLNINITAENQGDCTETLNVTAYHNLTDYTEPPGLVSCWKFDEDDGKTAADSTSTNNGTHYGNTKLLMHFDENEGSITNDSSPYNNNGIHYGNTRLLLHFDENVGTTAYDSSPYGNNGTIVGPIWVSGKSNSALRFDGLDDYLPASKNGFNANEGTIAMWIKGSFWNSGTDDYLWITTSLPGVARQFSILKNAGNWIYLFLIEDDGIFQAVGIDSSTFNPNKWYHLAGMWKNVNSGLNNGEVRFYVDGENVGTPITNANITISLPSSDYYIGSGILWEGHVGCVVNGTIDEVAVYSRALNPSEISEHYIAGRAKFIDWIVGRSGSALSFDGIDDYVEVADSPSLNNPTFTLSAWIYLDSDVGNTQRRIISKQYAGPRSFGFQIFGAGYGGSVGNQLCFLTSDGTGYANLLSPTNLLPQTWYHVVATYNGFLKRIYINGMLDSSQAYIGQTTDIPAPLVIGCSKQTSPSALTFFFHGTIDEVKIYNRDLSEEEIVADMMHYGKIASQTVTLEGGNPTTVIFTWNTTSFAKGNYTISAYAWPVLGETDKEDNNCTDGSVIVTMQGDFDGDNDIDIDDIRYFVRQYINYWNGRPYDDRCDFDHDKDIDIDDIRYFVKQYINYWKTGDP